MLSTLSSLPEVNDRVQKTMEKWAAEQHPVLRSALAYTVQMGGKRLRPYLVMSIGRLYGVSAEVLDVVASAIECLHTYSLIHDDLPCMDDSDYRRGRLSCHKKFDEATAVLTGNALMSVAFEKLASLEFSVEPELKCAVICQTAQSLGPSGMLAGQSLDLQEKASTLEEVLELEYLKTGCLLELCCVLPGILAKRSEKEQGLWRLFGKHIGLAFQIKDDILDKTSTASVLGKPVAHDGTKKTLVSFLGIDKAQEEVLRHGEIAKTFLEELSASVSQKDVFEELQRFVDYIVEREA